MVRSLLLLLALTPAVVATDKDLPAGALAQIGSNKLRHENMVIGVAFHPDGKTLASAGWDKLVRAWDASTGRPAGTFEDFKDPLFALTYSPDGKVLAAGGQQKVVYFWDAATRKKLREVNLPGPIARLLYLEKGKALAVVAGKCVVLIDPENGKELRRFANHDGELSAVAVSPDGKMLVAGGWDNRVVMYDYATGILQRQSEKFAGAVSGMQFSPDGKTLAVGCYQNAIHLLDAASLKIVATLAHTGSVWPVVFTPDGKTLATGDNTGNLVLWDVAERKARYQVKAHTSGLARLAISPDGKSLATASHDLTVRLWDAATGKELPQSASRFAGALTAAVLSPDGKLLAAIGKDSVVRLFEPATGKAIDQLAGNGPGALRGLAFAPDGSYLAAVDQGKDVTLWDPKSRKQIRKVSSDGPVYALALSPDGRLLAAGEAQSKRLSILETDTGKLRRKMEPDGHVTRLAFSPDGRTLAAAHATAAVELWNIDTGRMLRTLEGPGVPRSLAFSPDGRTLVVCGDGVGVWLFETSTGRRRRPLIDPKVKPSPASFCAAFSPDGRTVVTGGADRVVRCWDVATGLPLRQYEGHTGDVTCLSLTPDGRMLASGSADSTVIVWDTKDWLKPSPPAAGLTRAKAEELWKTLEADDAEKAHPAVWSLVGSPDVALALFRERLKPAEPKADAARLAKLIADLDDRGFNVREKATKELTALGPLAEKAVLKALEGNPSAEAKRRLDEVLETIRRATYPPEQVREIRALEVLEQIGTSAARELLEKMANGPADSGVTQEAKASLRRLSARRASP